jgi:hypothetical protein
VTPARLGAVRRIAGLTGAVSCALAATLAIAGSAGAPAGSVRDGEHHYQIVIAPGWTPVTAPDGTLLAYQGPGDRAHLAVTRVEIGRTGQRDHDRLADEIERGVERGTAGYRRTRRALSQIQSVPVLDLVYQQRASRPTRAGVSPAGHAAVMTRFLLFRRHTVVLTIGLEDGAPRALRREAERMAASFAPYLP